MAQVNHLFYNLPPKFASKDDVAKLEMMDCLKWVATETLPLQWVTLS